MSATCVAAARTQPDDKVVGEVCEAAAAGIAPGPTDLDTGTDGGIIASKIAAQPMLVIVAMQVWAVRAVEAVA